MTNGQLDGKVAIVTGAAGGFGRVLVAALLQEGASVCGLDVTRSGLDELSAVIPANDRNRLRTQLADISDNGACERAVEDARQEWGRVHILINNGALGMGVIRADHMRLPVDIMEITPEIWQRFFAVNFTGAWNMTRACVPMR